MLYRWKGTAWTLRNTKCVVLVLLLALLRLSILKRSAAWQAGLLRHSWGGGSLSSGKRLKLLRRSWLLDSGAGEGLCDVKDVQWILLFILRTKLGPIWNPFLSWGGKKTPKVLLWVKVTYSLCRSAVLDLQPGLWQLSQLAPPRARDMHGIVRLPCF